MTAQFVSGLIAAGSRLVAGASVKRRGYEPGAGPRIYFANHTSHFDFVVLWSALPLEERRRTRPVAGLDYWDTGAVRRYLANRVFRAVLVDRARQQTDRNPVDDMVAALDAGDSLILFPEGTRGEGHEIAPFKSGIFHVARRHPAVELVPVLIENLNRILPKGEIVPIPLLSSITLGAPTRLGEGEQKTEFLARLHELLGSLAREGNE